MFVGGGRDIRRCCFTIAPNSDRTTLVSEKRETLVQSRGQLVFWAAHPDRMGSSFFGVWHASGMFSSGYGARKLQKTECKNLLAHGVTLQKSTNANQTPQGVGWCTKRWGPHEASPHQSKTKFDGKRATSAGFGTDGLTRHDLTMATSTKPFLMKRITTTIPTRWIYPMRKR